MTGEFINKHCQFCDRCIFEGNGGDQVPKYCGEIDEGGCICDPIKEVQTCYYGYDPIPHVPRFKVGDVIKYEWGEEISTVIAINNDEYTLQKHGTFGRFNETYPQYNESTEQIDELFELYEDTKTDDAAEDYCDTTLVGSEFIKKNAFKAGAEWKMQDMIDQAVEAEVMYPASSKTLQVRYKLPKNTNLKYGDKVKIIILPKET
jgi:hypothetical protein